MTGQQIIRGVSRRVIEVERPESVWCERAVLYLRPGTSEVPLHTARAFLDTLADTCPHLKRGLWCAAGFAAGMWCAVALLGGVGL